MNIKPKVFTGPPVSLRLSDALYDGLCRLALRRDVPLAVVMRELLTFGLRHDVSQIAKSDKSSAH